jgi:hypothetical protein
MVSKAEKGTLDDYVPFYFAPRSPMLYTIQLGNVAGYEEGEGGILHLVSSAQSADAAGLKFAFTDGHAEMAVSEFFDDLALLDSKIDWAVMQSKYWNDTPDVPDRKRKRQAEFLIHNFFPWTLVDCIGVKDKTMKARVEEILEKESYRPQVSVKRDWYFE